MSVEEVSLTSSSIPRGRFSRAIFLATATLGSSWLISCRVSDAVSSRAGRTAASMSRIDGLTAAYPDLRAGRYAIVADFEDATHSELFHLRAASSQGGDARSQARLQTRARGGRAETGPECLGLTLASRDDALVIDDERAQRWALKRDWHDYDLLLLAVHSPMDKVDMLLTVRSGVSTNDTRRTDVRAAETRQRLRRGWNLLRYDLADLGEQIALDDVREIRIAAEAPRWPIELRLDDLILTSSRTDLFGDPDSRDGGMFTFRRGHRLHVGAGGRCEFVFGNGQIVGWYDLADDRRRVRNLWQGVSLAFDRRDEVAKGPAASAVSVSTHLKEANAVRSVLVTEVRLPETAAVGSLGLVSRWTYTIYPTGKVYAAVEFGPGFSGVFAEPPRLRLTTKDSQVGELGSVWFSGWPSEGEDRQTGYLSPRGAAASMAVVSTIPIDDSRSTERRTSLAEDGLVFGPAHAEQFDRTRPWIIALAHADHSIADENPVTFPGWFDGPRTIPLTARAGRSVSESVHFDSASGAYRVDAKQGSVRLDLPVDRGSYPFPAFAVTNTPSDEAWVYANNALVSPIARDANDQLIFQLPVVVRERTNVEILFGPSGGGSPRRRGGPS